MGSVAKLQYSLDQLIPRDEFDRPELTKEPMKSLTKNNFQLKQRRKLIRKTRLLRSDWSFQ